jgi:hypothetical protein
MHFKGVWIITLIDHGRMSYRTLGDPMSRKSRSRMHLLHEFRVSKIPRVYRTKLQAHNLVGMDDDHRESRDQRLYIYKRVIEDKDD